jgi:predicted TIM-barrel fold metal-dependent hydrolase
VRNNIDDWSRRSFLLSSTGFGVVTGVAQGRERSTAPEEDSRKGLTVKTIDTHIHVVNPRVPGVPSKKAPDGTPFTDCITKRAASICREMKSSGIEQALCMPRWENSEEDPLGINETLALAAEVPGLHAIGIADPTKIHRKHLDRVEAVLKKGRVKGFKAYLGYLHYGPDSPNYRPYLDLAAAYKLPFIFHTGDTFSHEAKVKYAHPLLVDEVAVDYPTVRFVIAHFGNPWLTDAAEVVYKNNKQERANVWVDLSGFVVGSAAEFEKYRLKGLLRDVARDIRKAFDYAERPHRFLYASDWPLIPMQTYRDFMHEVIPEEHHRSVFRDNAKELFAL